MAKSDPVYRDYFLRAAKEEIGIAIEFSEPLDAATITHGFHASRPPGFEDYSVSIPSIPNTVFIIKPGVTLD